MPAIPEASRLSLEYYRKAAKSLLKTAQSGDVAARERIARHSHAPALALHQAQLTIAREQGFPSWPRFRAFLVESALDFQGLTAKFINAATEDLHTAEEILARHPAVAHAGFFPALVLGDGPRVEQAIADLPTLATANGGPNSVPPLVYVCFSRYANPRSGRAAQLAGVARLLLEHGPDPNTAYNSPQWPDNPLSVLYAASGLNNNLEMTRLLLDAGARTEDGESLYHSTEHPDLACFRLLLERGARPNGANALNHMLDREDPRVFASSWPPARIRTSSTTAARRRCTGRFGAAAARASSRCCSMPAQTSPPAGPTAARLT